MNDLGFTMLIIIIFCCVIVMAEILYQGLKIKGVYTRVFIQCAAGVFGLVYPFTFVSSFPAVLITIFFIGVTRILEKRNLLQSLFDIGRKSIGVETFLIGYLLIFLVYQKNHAFVFVFLPCIYMAFSDGMATLIGTRFPWQPYKVFGSVKTLSGSIAFFVTSFILTTLIFHIFLASFPLNLRLMFTLFISISCTLVEAISVKGTDNITVPFTAMLWLFYIDNNTLTYE